MKGEFEMLKKVVKYTDYDGNQVEKEFCFNLSKIDCMDLNFEYEEFGGLKGYLMSLINVGDPNDPDRIDKIPKKPLWEFLKKMIHMSVGRQSADRKRFEKSPEITADFEQSNAYGEFVFELLESPDSIPTFLTSIMPEVDETAMNEAKKQLEEQGIKLPE